MAIDSNIPANGAADHAGFIDIKDLVAGTRGAIVLDEGGVDAGIWSAGQSQALIHDIPTCAELVSRIMREAEAIIRQRICAETGITRFGTVEDVADLVCFMVSTRATWLQGATIDLDGGEIPVL